MNPNVKLAVKTLAAIDIAMEADQGNSFRYWQKQVLPHINDAYRQDDETDKFRSHLGASTIGDECARKAWYSFRWATNKKFPGRILRLFNRGHLEEGRFLAMLLMIGCKVFQQNADGSQFKISRAGGHFGGSGDGVVVDIPDLQPGQPCLIESKTHGEKSFLELKKNGVRESKFDHYVQMQMYMGEMGLAVALYMAVNKNTDELHLELIAFNKEIFEQFADLADKLPFLKDPPQRISNSSGWYKCVICDHRKMCHSLGAVPEVNCRTCVSVESQLDGTWLCTKFGNFLTKEEQIAGCKDYARGL